MGFAKDQEIEEMEEEIERQERRESWPKPPSLWWAMMSNATLDELEALEIRLFGKATSLDELLEE